MVARLGLGCLVAGLLLAPGCGKDDPSPSITLVGDGVRVTIALDPFELRIVGRAGEVLRSLTGGAGPYGAPAVTRDDGPDGTRVLPGWDGYFPEERPWVHGVRVRNVTSRSETAASLDLETSGGVLHLDLRVERETVRLRLVATENSSAPTGWNKTALSFALRPDEHFFGLGERFASVDHRGLSLYSWAEEGGTGKGEKIPRDDQNPFPNGPSMTYFPVPFFLSSAGYAVHLGTTFRTETHLGSERPDAWRVAAATPAFDATIYVHEDPLASLDDFTRDTGRPFVPAPWVFGPRRRVSVEQRVGDVEEWRKLRQAHVPTTGLDDAVHFLPARSELGREAALAEWTRTAHAWGFKVMAYATPYVSTSKPEAAADLAYAKDHALLVRTAEGAIAETEFISGEKQTLATIDLTKPEAVAWFQGLLRRTLALGYDGWMHDFGEYVRRSWVFADGRKGDELHNLFPVLSAQAAHDVLVRERPDDFLFFVRAGYTGTQQWVPAVWSGDPEATFDETQGLPAMLRGGLNLGMSGVPLWGSDLTGFKCLTEFPNDKEMYLRWAELGAVSPIMMEQNACANPLGRRTKWKLWDDEETTLVYAEMARLHTRLAPYFDVLVRESAARGIPIMRHPFLHHPKEPAAWRTESAFYLGRSLFAAPVVERGSTEKRFWLPGGRWVDLADHAVLTGGAEVTLPAPLGRLPLLLADGGIVPLLDPSVETLAPATEPGVVSVDQVRDRLDVLVALSPGREASIVLADGTTLRVVRAAGAGGAPSALPDVAPDVLAACDGCVRADPEPSLDRLRLTTPLVASHQVTHGDLVFEARGPIARRVRWDVLRLRP